MTKQGINLYDLAVANETILTEEEIEILKVPIDASLKLKEFVIKNKNYLPVLEIIVRSFGPITISLCKKICPEINEVIKIFG